MLTDPFVLKAPTLSSHTALTGYQTLSLPRVQEQGGASIYGPVAATISSNGGLKVSMKVSHSESNENKPSKTRRVMVRLDVTGVAPDGSPKSAFAYFVMGFPDIGIYGTTGYAVGDEDGTGALQDWQLLQLLIGALAVSNSGYTLDETRITRLMSGES